MVKGKIFKKYSNKSKLRVRSGTLQLAGKLTKNILKYQKKLPDM